MPLSDVDFNVKDGAASDKTIKHIVDGSGKIIPTAALRDSEGALISSTNPLYVRPLGYDAQDDMMKIKSVQKKFRDSFVGASLNAAKWDSSVGTGGAVSVGSGLLTMGSGTTISSETSITTKEIFTIPFRINIGLTLSQRIANQTFYVEAISVDPVTGTPDGLHSIGMLWDGTTATQGKYEVKNSGASALTSAAVTLPTTASGGFYEIEPFSDEAWFHGGTLDSTTARTNSYRRHQQIPDPNAYFKVRLRWLNGGSAPASNTNAVVQYLSVQDYAELTAEITGGRGQSVAGQGLAVTVAGTVTTTFTQPALVAGSALVGDVGMQVRANATGAATIHHFVAAGSTNALNIKNAAGRVYGWALANTTASWRYVKLHNSNTLPTAGSGVVATIAIPPNGLAQVTIPHGLSFSAGIGRTCVTGVADTDATAVTANDVVGDIFFS